MSVLQYFLHKRESFSAHLAWGALLGLVAAHRAGDALLAIPLAACLGVAWELVSGRLTNGAWRPAPLDVVPWVLGGVLAAFLEARLL